MAISTGVVWSKLKDPSISKWLIIIAYAVLALVFTIFAFLGTLGVANNEPEVFPFVVGGLLFIPAVVLFIKLLLEYKGHPEAVFLLLAIPTLFLFCFFMLPNQVPDEMWHIYLAFDLTSSGDRDMVVPTVFNFPDVPANYAQMQTAIFAASDYSSTILIDRDMSDYLKHMYLLPGLFANIGEALNFNPYAVIYLARMANVVLFLSAGYWALKIIPFGKVLLLVYLLNPILIQQEASCSADAFLNVAAILFIAYFLKLKFQEGIRPYEWVVLIILLILTMLSKFAYGPLALLLLLFVPRIKSGAKRKTIYFGVAILIIMIAAYVLFAYSGSSFRPTIDLMRDPGECLLVLARSLYHFGHYWIESFAGGLLGSLSILVWEPNWWFYMALLITALFNSLGEKVSFSKFEKAFVTVLVFVMAAVIVLIFREWAINADGNYDVISGFQGRYMLPLAILPLLAIINSKKMLVRPNCLVVYATLLTLVHLVSFVTVVRFFL